MQITDILVAQGLVNEAQLNSAFEASQTAGQSMGVTLMQMGLITESQYVAALAHQIGMDFVDLGEYPISRHAVMALPAAIARKYSVLPIDIEDGVLILATADPSDVLALDDVRSTTGMEIQLVIATRRDVISAIDRYMRADDELHTLSSTLEEEADEDVDLSELSEISDDDAPIIKFVNLLISQAIQDRASDIHVEPAENSLRVRYRIDGVLHEAQEISKSLALSITSRIKILAEIDIAERRKPQDGRMSITHNGRKIDLRVATLPTVWGEKIVLRILDNTTAAYDLMDLGFSKDNLARFRESFTKPYGMILATGPTGSGKSTTLYATLNIISRPEINVITVEDPVEYRLPSINQIQVNPLAGLTFASALRSILRSDPDVVLLGEIRDRETAQIAIEAALTGHLVLSTLHTNDAPSAVTRLTEMGIEPFLVGSAIDCVVAQRLARRLCSRCKTAYIPTEEEYVRARFPGPEPSEIPELFRPVGCSSCANTGYKGRLAFHEVMTINEEIERLTVRRASAAEIVAAAAEDGMTSLRQDGLAKVLTGETSLEEIFRVII